ncbi:hypothetical protein [Gordonia neofelifaecis]|uniref:Low-density lipoprotein receptor YWTD repeat protein n=1 Tax=Gordonia neofelifaecis NRRL B-59395 TaxID=644548 RepID=F1YDV4_9ACTN|nr:hypothetical protein [Gordonia neofelifaecis]EGD57044.1 low-density lipoprotein receptor YWTD repeat protein [Gordonia neofelifaecis NRRL B-59395]
MTALLALGLATRTIFRVDVADGRASVLLKDTAYSPDGVVVIDGTVYWTTMGRPTRNPEVEGEAAFDYSAPTGGLHAVGLDGTGRRDVLPAGSVTTGKQLAADGRGRLYWSDREGLRVSSCRLDGSDWTDLIVNTQTGDGTAECVGCAVAGEYLYWTQKGPSKGARGRILRAGLTVPDGESADDRTDVETLWDGLPEPVDLQVVDGILYWTDRGAEPDGNTLNRAPIPSPGEVGEPPEILARGLHEAVGVAVDSRAGLAYVSDLGGTILAVALDGTGDRVVVDLGQMITGITLVR